MSDDDRAAAELRGLLGFAHGLGLDEAIVREIYEIVRHEASAAGASDDDGLAEVRERMLAARQSSASIYLSLKLWRALSVNGARQLRKDLELIRKLAFDLFNSVGKRKK